MPEGTGTGTDCGEGQAGAAGEGQATQTTEAGQGTEAGSDTGKAASSTEDFEALYKQALTQSRKWETRAKDNAGKAKKWDEAEAANRTETEQAADRAQKAEARAQAAITSAVNAEIRAAARGWANPDDAPRYLDDKAKYVNEDGDIDAAAITEDLAAVLDDRPHLAVSTSDTGRRGPNPDASQGARGRHLDCRSDPRRREGRQSPRSASAQDRAAPHQEVLTPQRVSGVGERAAVARKGDRRCPGLPACSPRSTAPTMWANCSGSPRRTRHCCPRSAADRRPVDRLGDLHLADLRPAGAGDHPSAAGGCGRPSA